MIFPAWEDIGAGFLFCPEVIARDENAGSDRRTADVGWI